MVSPGTGRDEKCAPISAASIHIGALVGAGFTLAGLNYSGCYLLNW